VLAVTVKVARDRKQMIAGGGPFTRMIEVAEPPLERTVRRPPIPLARNAGIDRTIVQHMLELQLQPKAYACYQHALAAQLAASHKPTLAGTAVFRIELGRGEVARVELSGVGDAGFDACLLDAAYAMSPPLPDPDRDADERTIATYPLSFALREERPIVVAGDADSASPLDIESIRGGAAAPNEASTPLGNLRP
jgi:hypothetical protein